MRCENCGHEPTVPVHVKAKDDDDYAEWKCPLCNAVNETARTTTLSAEMLAMVENPDDLEEFELYRPSWLDRDWEKEALGEFADEEPSDDRARRQAFEDLLDEDGLLDIEVELEDDEDEDEVFFSEPLTGEILRRNDPNE